jgi:putative ABC transport system permease protein
MNLPAWARAVLALTPARRRGDGAAEDLAELYLWRRRRDGPWPAGARLVLDVLSLRLNAPRGGSMLTDMKFAGRLLRKHRAAATIAIGGLAAAIGGATAVFSVINATILRPYGVNDPSSLVSMSRPAHGSWPYWPYAHFLRAREAAALTSLEGTVTEQIRVSLSSGDATAPRRLVTFCTGGFLPLLGVTPSMGRVLGPPDDQPTAPHLAVVTHHYWTTQLSGAQDAVGRTIWINSEPATVVGILPSDFSAPLAIQPSIYLALAGYDEVLLRPEFRASTMADVEVLGRLRSGATLGAAEAELLAILLAQGAVRPASADAPFQPVRLFSAASPVSGADAGELYAGVAFTLPILALVLLLACSNASNLLRATAAARTREIGVRLALGASARRVAKQLLVESVLLSLIAAGAGWLLAVWLSPALAMAIDVSPELRVAPDGRVLAFAVFAAVCCGVLSGLGPARLGSRGDVLSAVQARPVPDRAIWRTGRRHGAVVGFQAAVSMFLLTIAALLAHSAVRVQQLDLGFDADRLLAVQFSMPRKDFDQQGYLDAAVAAMRRLPSVEDVTISQTYPFGPLREIHRLQAASRPYTVFGIRSDASYFRTAGVDILRGRPFTAEEVSAEAPVVVIGGSLARDLFDGADPLGRSLSEAALENERLPAATIVGVAEDTLASLPQSERFSTIYRPLERKRANPPAVLLRTANPATAARHVERAIAAIDPNVEVTTALPGERVEAVLRNKRVVASLAAATAGLALILAVIGLYGVTTLKVSERMREAGIRLAIGAAPKDIVRMMARQALLPLMAGVTIGLLMATLAASLLAGELAGIRPLDPLSLPAAVIALVLPAVLAVWIPASRAGRIDPLTSIRQE